MHKASNAFVFLGLVAGLSLGCRGTLPPTEPPRVGNEATPGTRTNDGPTLGPLTGGILAAGGSGSGGTNVLPTPPMPGPGGSGGAGATAGRGIH